MRLPLSLLLAIILSLDTFAAPVPTADVGDEFVLEVRKAKVAPKKVPVKAPPRPKLPAKKPPVAKAKPVPKKIPVKPVKPAAKPPAKSVKAAAKPLAKPAAKTKGKLPPRLALSYKGSRYQPPVKAAKPVIPAKKPVAKAPVKPGKNYPSQSDSARDWTGILSGAEEDGGETSGLCQIPYRPRHDEDRK
ncbi:hypothetical protein DFH09DRAFT_1359290 [Mycena vulgaris]|nr:hypothetical protein DFH09DRAFT_1359290 [Mycena vulgaris]